METRIRLTEYQRSVLNALIDAYENSSISSIERLRSRPPAVKPSVAVRDYFSASCSLDILDYFHKDMELLEKNKDVFLVWEIPEITLKKIKLNIDHIDEIYCILGRTKVEDSICKYKDFYEKACKETNERIVQEYCKEELRKINQGRMPRGSIRDCEAFLYVLQAVLSNDKEVLERKFSMSLFESPIVRQSGANSASKFFGIIKSRVATVLEKYGDYSDITAVTNSDTEKDKLIFEKHLIVQENTQVLVKGDGWLIFDNGDRIPTHSNESTPIYSNKMEHLVAAEIAASKVMTIENKTNFLDAMDKEFFFIFVSGYHKRGQQHLIKIIKESNKICEWRHFGDLDPWGFSILEILRERTGVDFIPWKMGIAEYLDTKYEYARIKMNDEDRRVAEDLIKKGLYVDIMESMLKNGYKFEQEAIEFT